jgi:CTP:molybdopterin cytidylyltransferase MocA
MGTPKALLHDADGTSWLLRSLAALRAGGCDRVVVVLGASADRARTLLEGAAVGEDVDVVVAEDWDEGMGASLRAGLTALRDTDATAALVSLVDLPDVDARVVARLLGSGSSGSTLRRAAYAGTPGHPVLIGRDHWAGVVGSATGDQGARGYLGRPQVESEIELVECGDLATGADVDAR